MNWGAAAALGGIFEIVAQQGGGGRAEKETNLRGEFSEMRRGALIDSGC
jgi:hypothetical protein